MNVRFKKHRVERETEDFKEFGDAWVYCNQHQRAHKTGWCTVSARNKVALCSGEKSEEEATAKCNAWGFKLYQPNTPAQVAAHPVGQGRDKIPAGAGENRVIANSPIRGKNGK
jgi:hypothetical protein